MNTNDYIDSWAGLSRFWKTNALEPLPAVDECLDVESRHSPAKGTEEEERFSKFEQLITRLLSLKRYSKLIQPLLDKHEPGGKQCWPLESAVSLLDKCMAESEAKDRFWVSEALIAVIDGGNRVERWKIPIPGLSAQIPQEKSPFTTDEFEKGLIGANIRQAFIAGLGVSSLNENNADGCIVLSALLFDAVYDYEFLAQIPDAIRQSKDDVRWLDLQNTLLVGAGSAVYIEKRRVVLGPVTSFLAVCLKKIISSKEEQSSFAKTTSFSKNESKKTAWKNIKRYSSANGMMDELPSSLPKLITCAQMRMRLDIPSVFVTYALEKGVSTSLPPKSWDRLISPRFDYASEYLPDIQHTTIEEDVRSNAIKADEGAQAFGDESIPELGRLYRCVNLSAGMKKNELALALLKNWHKEIDNKTPSSIPILAKWVESRLKHSKHGRHPPGTSTVYGHLTTIGKRLIGQLGLDDITQLSEDDLIELYQTAIDDADTPQLKRSVTWVLREFHRWLSETYDLPDLVDSGLFAMRGKRAAAIDANIVSEGVLNRAIRWIDQSEQSTEERREAAVLLMALGFYGSLRRSEAVGLRVSDIQGYKLKHIQVRRHALTRLKSGNAIRRIPLGLLMPPSIHKRFSDWHCRFDSSGLREAEDIALFTLQTTGEILTKDSSVFDLIKEALYRASHDRTLRFHHLRHSFASWLTLKLYLAEHPNQSLPGWFLPDAESRDGLSAEKIAHIRSELLGETPTSRRQFWQVANIIGHYGPDMTLGHYIHLMDLMLGMAIRSSTPDISKDVLAALMGQSKRHIERIITKNNWRDLSMADLLDALSDYHIRTNKNEVGSDNFENIQTDESSIVYELPVTGKGKLQLIDAVVNSVVKEGVPVERVAHKYSLSPQAVKRCADNYHALPEQVKKACSYKGRKSAEEVQLLRMSKKVVIQQKWVELYKKLGQYLEPLVVDEINLNKVKASKSAWADAKLFMECWVNNKDGCLFVSKLPVAKRLFKWLAGLDVQRENLAVLFMANKKSTVSNASQKKHWAEVVGIMEVDDRNNIFRSLPSRGAIIIQGKQLKLILEVLVRFFVAR